MANTLVYVRTYYLFCAITVNFFAFLTTVANPQIEEIQWYDHLSISPILPPSQAVLLKQPEELGLGFPQWDPRLNVADRSHVMPIITPAYPSQNSTFNVTPSTRDVMKREFEQSLAVCEEVWAGRAGWEKLFETPNFFAKYKHFIVLQASSASEEDQLEWYGLVESKVRHLVGYLEKEAIDLVHVWPKTYPSLEAGREKTCCYWFLGLVIRQQQQQASAGGEAPVQQPQSLDLTTPIKKFTELVMGTAITIKRWKEGMKVEADYRKRKQLAQYLPPSERHKLRTERRSTPAAAATSAANAASAASATAGNSQQQTGGAADPSEAAPAAAPTAAAAATDTAAAGENSAPPSATAPASNTTAAAPTTPTPSAAGKRRPSDNDDASNGGGGGGSGGGQVDGSGEAAGEQPPPMKRSNTADSEMSNGVQVS